ncbi:hypothetical protein DIPPA_06117 [Diplonema papillatum]|nr:hypothetical protein DIPPA_06117 [Diplonema papillatum]
MGRLQAPATAAGAGAGMSAAAGNNRKPNATRKVWGESISASLVSWGNSKSLCNLRAIMGQEVEIVERFVGKELVFCSGNLSREAKTQLKAKTREFKREVRHSRVLILSIKDKRTLTLDEGKDIVFRSPLRNVLHRIELIAVNPKKFDDKQARRETVPMVHVYVQFATEDEAHAQVNMVDAMPHGEFFVHSPQCDEHAVFYPNDNYSFYDHVWLNDKYTGFTGLLNVNGQIALNPMPPQHNAWDQVYYQALHSSMVMSKKRQVASASSSSRKPSEAGAIPRANSELSRTPHLKYTANASMLSLSCTRSQHASTSAFSSVSLASHGSFPSTPKESDGESSSYDVEAEQGHTATLTPSPSNLVTMPSPMTQILPQLPPAGQQHHHTAAMVPLLSKAPRAGPPPLPSAGSSSSLLLVPTPRQGMAPRPHPAAAGGRHASVLMPQASSAPKLPVAGQPLLPEMFYNTTSPSNSSAGSPSNTAAALPPPTFEHRAEDPSYSNITIHTPTTTPPSMTSTNQDPVPAPISDGSPMSLPASRPADNDNDSALAYDSGMLSYFYN